MMKLRIKVVIVYLIFIGILNLCKNGDWINSEIVITDKADPLYISKGDPVEQEEAAVPGTPHKPQEREYEAQFFSVNLPGQLDYKKLKEAGIGKIIVRVFQDERRSGGLFFRSSLFRTISPHLEKITAEINSQKQEAKPDLCAWMITRRFSWVSYTNLFDYQYKNGRRELIRKFDVFNPAAIDRIVETYRELAQKDIDSILIQDDFFIRYNEGFSDWGKAAFARAAGLPARENLMMQSNTPYNKRWNQVKREQLNKVLGLIIKSCKQVNPDIKIGMNIYYETPFYIEKGEDWYAHNLWEIVNTGVDYLYLMSYHRQIKKEMRLTESNTRLMFRRILERAYEICRDKLTAKLQIRDWDSGERIPLSEARAYLDIIPAGVKRICFAPVKPGDYDYLKELIKPR